MRISNVLVVLPVTTNPRICVSAPGYRRPRAEKFPVDPATTVSSSMTVLMVENDALVTV